MVVYLDSNWIRRTFSVCFDVCEFTPRRKTISTPTSSSLENNIFHCFRRQFATSIHSYMHVHGYLSLVVCFFGCIANTLNIIVLTRHEMRSPTNYILTGLALADLLVMLDYIPYVIIVNLLPLFRVSRELRLAYSATWFVMFHSIFAQICHTISIWLTVTLAIWRYIAVAMPQKNRLWCSMRTTMVAILSSYCVCPFIGIPLYLSLSILERVELQNANGEVVKNNTTLGDMNVHNVTVYLVSNSKLASSDVLHSVNLWIYSVAIKLIPCVALTILSQRLIAALVEAKRRRKLLTSGNNALKTIVNGKVVEQTNKSKHMEKEKQTDRTTRMLLAVLLLFLITEFPQGILGLLSALLEKQFFMNCYLKLGEQRWGIDERCRVLSELFMSVLYVCLTGDFLDLLALLNSSINFILYCSMSRQFRLTFAKLFRPKFLDYWTPVDPNGDDEDDMHDGCRTDVDKDNQNGGRTTTQVTQV